jgi:hypothetical protein
VEGAPQGLESVIPAAAFQLDSNTALPLSTPKERLLLLGFALDKRTEQD